jgi:hypothetical protein
MTTFDSALVENALGCVAAGRRSDGMTLVARLCHVAGLFGSHEATVATLWRRPVHSAILFMMT